MKMLERKSRQEENKALRDILKTSDRSSIILNEDKSSDETLSFIRVLAKKEIFEGNCSPSSLCFNNIIDPSWHAGNEILTIFLISRT